MMRKLLAVSSALLASSGMVLVSSLPALAGTDPVTDLVIHGPHSTVTVTCDPWGGEHPYTKEVCTQIDTAQGRIDRIPPMAGKACTTEYNPVTVSVTGFWHGTRVSYESKETNPGCAAISRGHVFFF
jgi:hypothetical protein